MRILALEPFFGGSHRAFLEGWQQGSRHEFTVLALPGYKWKWRMRHAAVTLANQLWERSGAAREWDVVWVSDMLNLAEFLGLAPEAIRLLPRVVYFHENQLTYPVRQPRERDYHFGFTNFTSALAADAVWFNSDYHRSEFLDALQTLFARMPDYAPSEALPQLRLKSSVQSPGVPLLNAVVPRPPGPLRICWNARWEFDKNPLDFFAALRMVRAAHLPFRLIVLGESFRQVPPVFAQARQEFAAELDQWGFVESLADYHSWLQLADVVVSTADHEFFGVGVVEAMSAGAVPLLPRRLAYPGVLVDMGLNADDYLYDGTVADLGQRLLSWGNEESLAQLDAQRARVAEAAAAYSWPQRARALDAALEGLVRRPK